MNAILVGGGRPIQFLAQSFHARGHTVTIVNRNARESERLSRLSGATVVLGDGSDPLVLESAGARSADVVLAATPHDADNLIVCQTARARFGVPRAVALVNDPDNRTVFEQLGVDAISPALTVASLIEQRVALDQVTNLIPAAEGKVRISEVTLNGDSHAIGKPLAGLQFPRDALIAVVIRDGGVVIPGGGTELRSGDRVLVVSLAEAHDRAVRHLTGRRA